MTATALAVAGLVWRRLRRDRVGLAFTFLMPIALAVVMAGIAQGVTPRVGVVDRSPAGVGDAIEARLAAGGLVEVRRYPDRAGLERAVRRREIAAGVVVPADAGHPGDAAAVDLVGPPGVAAPDGVRAVVESAVADTAAALALGHTLDPGGDPRAALAAGTRALGDAPSRPAGSADARRRADVAGALVGTLVLFAFVNTVGGAGTLADMRQLGALARARAVGAPPIAVAAGCGLGVVSLAGCQVGLMVVTARVGFGVAWAGGAAFAVALAATVAAAGGAGLLVATFLPTPEAGGTVAGPAAFLAGMLGGCLWPLSIVGPGLRALGHLTPQAWAVDALQRTGVAGAGLAAVAGPLAVLGAAAAGTVVLGGWRLHRIAGHA